MIKKLIIIYLFSIYTLYANYNYNDNDNDNYMIPIILHREDIDLDSKSIKGWIRVLNSKEKMLKYHIFLTDKERELLINYLKKLYETDYNHFSKRIR